MSDITVVGSLVMDTVATLDVFPTAGQTVLGRRLRTYPGGKGANQCVACARLGGDCEMIGMLGTDGNASVFREIFLQEGIESGNIFSSPTEPTSIAQIQIDGKGENKIVVIPSANHGFGLKHLNSVRGRIEKTKLVVGQLELRHEVCIELVRMCAKAGTPISLNPAPAVPLGRDVLSQVDYLTPNETELEILTDRRIGTQKEREAACEYLLGLGVKHVITTLGSRGALIADGDGIRTVPAYFVEAVDTVAAGDAFNGALALGIVRGLSLDEAVVFANAVGALTVTKHGAIPSLPSMQEVERFLEGNKQSK